VERPTQHTGISHLNARKIPIGARVLRECKHELLLEQASNKKCKKGMKNIHTNKNKDVQHTLIHPAT